MVGPAPGMPSVSPGDVLLQPSPSRDREQGDARIAEVRTRGPGLAVLLEAAITFVTRHHRARGGTEVQASRYKLTRGSQEICQLLVRSWIPNSRLWRNKLEGLTSGESPGKREFRALEKAAGRRLCLLPSGVSQEVWFSSQGYCVQVASFPSVGPGANVGINLGFTASEQGRVPWCCCFTDRE